MTLIILACAIPSAVSCWPLFVCVFYMLSPLPTLLAKRYNVYTSGRNPAMECAIFITIGLVISSFAFPIVLVRAPSHAITLVSCYLTLLGNVIFYATLVGLFMAFVQDDGLGGI